MRMTLDGTQVGSGQSLRENAQRIAHSLLTWSGPDPGYRILRMFCFEDPTERSLRFVNVVDVDTFLPIEDGHLIVDSTSYHYDPVWRLDHFVSVSERDWERVLAGEIFLPEDWDIDGREEMFP